MGAVAAAAPAPPTLSGLLEAFRKAGSLRAQFKDEKHLAMLAVPLSSEGDIYFAAPDRLSRRVRSPTPSAMLIRGNHLSFSEGHGVQTLPLNENAVARMLVDSFVRILAGDEEGLKGLYAIKLVPGRGDGWSLELTPKDADLHRIIERIDLDGHAVVVQHLRVREAGGDETVTTFTAVELGKSFTSDELKRYFELDR